MPGGELEEWAEWMQATGASDKTVTTRINGVVSLGNYVNNDDPVTFTTREIIRWLAHCTNPWTRRTYAATARTWHRWLVEHELRADDPTEKIPMPPQPKGIPRPAASSILNAVLEVAPRRARAYILLAAYVGLRVHEIAKVRGEDFQGEWLYVTGKGGKAAAVPVHPLVAQLQHGFPCEGWWFPNASGSDHILPGSVSATVSRAFAREGHHTTAHQLRHWFGTHTLRNSRDLRVTQELLRHASLSSTQIYTEVASRAKVEAVRRLAS